MLFRQACGGQQSRTDPSISSMPSECQGRRVTYRWPFTLGTKSSQFDFQRCHFLCFRFLHIRNTRTALWLPPGIGSWEHRSVWVRRTTISTPLTNTLSDFLISPLPSFVLAFLRGTSTGGCGSTASTFVTILSTTATAAAAAAATDAPELPLKGLFVLNSLHLAPSTIIIFDTAILGFLAAISGLYTFKEKKSYQNSFLIISLPPTTPSVLLSQTIFLSSLQSQQPMKLYYHPSHSMDANALWFWKQNEIKHIREESGLRARTCTILTTENRICGSIILVLLQAFVLGGELVPLTCLEVPKKKKKKPNSCPPPFFILFLLQKVFQTLKTCNSPDKLAESFVVGEGAVILLCEDMINIFHAPILQELSRWLWLLCKENHGHFEQKHMFQRRELPHIYIIHTSFIYRWPTGSRLGDFHQPLSICHCHRTQPH